MNLPSQYAMPLILSRGIDGEYSSGKSAMANTIPQRVSFILQFIELSSKEI